MSKKKNAPQYIIGIDLGTTNTTMAYSPVDGALNERDLNERALNQFTIPQVTATGTEEALNTLPSFLYFPLEEELSKQVAGISWDKSRAYAVGAYAKERGGELPGRVIASAKSWLCHDGIDRRGKTLPQGTSEGNGKMSPVEASTAILCHLREAWEAQLPEAPFAEQMILVTVPASFDPSARQLVEEAAEAAGYPEILLLEEPQAAFYAWLQKHSKEWRKTLSVGDNILVVDVGGGTTDFSLISVAEENGDLTLNRVAVGAHLLLGGDNMDLALAYLTKEKLEKEGHSIDNWQLQSLIHVCRKAKETLLGIKPPKKVDITIHGRGSGLIGGTLTTALTSQEVHTFLIDGFVPLVAATERSRPEKRSGLQQIGLPYAQDPRISSQLAKFLSMTGTQESDTMASFIMPTAVLFNGGTMKAKALEERLVELLNSWANELGKPPIKVLPDADYEYAVSQGAVTYGMARSGKAIRIKGGTSRSYFIGVEGAAPAVPGIPTRLHAICVAPFGMEEGSEAELQGQQFALLLGEQATFRFFSRATPALSNGSEPTVGQEVPNWSSELLELHPIETLLEKGAADGRTICVKLKSRVTELGAFELWCVAEDGRKWKLEFDIRKHATATA